MICLGYVKIKLSEVFLFNEEFMKSFEKNCVLGRYFILDEMVGLVVFLVLDVSFYMIGFIIVNDGGLLYVLLFG